MTDEMDTPAKSDAGCQLYLIEIYDERATTHPDVYKGAYIMKTYNSVSGGFNLDVHGEDDDIVAMYPSGKWRKFRQLPDTENNRRLTESEGAVRG